MLATVLLITQIHRAIGFRQEIASIDAEIENSLTTAIGIIQPFPSEHLTGSASQSHRETVNSILGSVPTIPGECGWNL